LVLAPRFGGAFSFAYHAAPRPAALRRKNFSLEQIRSTSIDCSMNSSLASLFENFAECCLDLARAADTPARRARLFQMAHEQQATSLMDRRMEDVGGVERNHPITAGSPPGKKPGTTKCDEGRITAVISGEATGRLIGRSSAWISRLSTTGWIPRVERGYRIIDVVQGLMKSRDDEDRRSLPPRLG
jgi:hypothetical protein